MELMPGPEKGETIVLNVLGQDSFFQCLPRSSGKGQEDRGPKKADEQCEQCMRRPRQVLPRASSLHCSRPTASRVALTLPLRATYCAILSTIVLMSGGGTMMALRVAFACGQA